MSVNLIGTLIIFSHHEYGSVNNTTVMYVNPNSNLDEKLELFVQLTGYPLEHERYKTEIIDLSKYYFGLHYGADVGGITNLITEYAPEILEDIQAGRVYSERLLRQHGHLGYQTWLNRLYPEVKKFVGKTVKARAAERSRRKCEEISL